MGRLPIAANVWLATELVKATYVDGVVCMVDATNRYMGRKIEDVKYIATHTPMHIVAAGGYYGKGTYYWGGAAGTWFWIDPTDDLIVIGMIQQLSGTGAAAAFMVPDVRGLSRAYVYQAVVD